MKGFANAFSSRSCVAARNDRAFSLATMASTRAGLQWGTLAPVLATALVFAVLMTRRPLDVKAAPVNMAA